MVERADIVDCLRVSVTDRCNLRCVYCMPAEGTRPSSGESLLGFEEMATVARFLCDYYGLRTVRLTGGDPLAHPGVVPLAEMLARLPIGDLAITTNGQRLSDLARPLRQAGVGRVNISLDSLDRTRFGRLTRGGRLDRTLAGIGAARAAGFDSIKINTVVLRGENDSEVCDLARFAGEAGLEIRFLELMAIGVAAPHHPAWFVSSDEVRDRLSARYRLTALPTPCGDRTRTYLAEDARGCTTRIGFISPETEPFCATCRRLRLTADGRLLGCLMHSTGPDVLPLLRRPGGPDFAGLDRAVRAALEAKPVLRRDSSPRLMAAIGG